MTQPVSAADQYLLDERNAHIEWANAQRALKAADGRRLFTGHISAAEHTIHDAAVDVAPTVGHLTRGIGMSWGFEVAVREGAIYVSSREGSGSGFDSRQEALAAATAVLETVEVESARQAVR